ncbi:MAG: hypothetical protein NEHIOOID_00677 [Holosporales bacterium]
MNIRVTLILMGQLSLVFAAPYKNYAIDPAIQLMKKGQENGRKPLVYKDKIICAADHEGHLRFGVLAGDSCIIPYANAKKFPMDGDLAFLVHAPLGGAWKKKSELPVQDAATQLIKGQDGDFSIAAHLQKNAIGVYDGKSFFGVTDASPDQIVENKEDQFEVFEPAVLINPFKTFPYDPNMILLRKGQEGGRPLLKAPKDANDKVGTSDRLVCVGHDAKNGSFRFGWAKDDHCLFESWGVQQASFSAGDAFFVSVSGEWLPYNDQTKERIEASLKQTLISGDKSVGNPASQENVVGGFQVEQGNKLTYSKENMERGDSADKSKIIFFVKADPKAKADADAKAKADGDAKAKADADAKAKADADAKVKADADAKAKADADAKAKADADAKAKADADAKAKADGDAKGAQPQTAPAVTPVAAPVATPVAAAATPVAVPVVPSQVSAPVAVVAAPPEMPAPKQDSKPDSSTISEPFPDPIVTQMMGYTRDKVLQMLNTSKVLVSQDDTKLLDAQKSLDLVGQKFTWVDSGSGYAVDAVRLFEGAGSAVCRFQKGDKVFIGNTYMNNVETAQAKLNQFICRAATNLDNMVYLSTQFQILSTRGKVKASWASIQTIKSGDWELGYRGVKVGDKVKGLKDTMVTISGVCRKAKDKTGTVYHIGRAELDATGAPHCFLKKEGRQVDLFGDALKDVDVLVSYNVSKVLGASGFSHMEENNTGVSINSPDEQLMRLKRLIEEKNSVFG